MIVVLIGGYAHVDFRRDPEPGVQVVLLSVEAGGVADQQLPAEVPAQQHIVLAPFLTGGIIGPVGVRRKRHGVLDIAAVDPQFVQPQGLFDGIFHIRQEGHLEPGIHQSLPGIVPQAGIVRLQGQEPLQGILILGRIAGQLDDDVVQAQGPAGLGQDIVLSQPGKGRHVHIGDEGARPGPVDFPETDVEGSPQVFQPAAPVHPDAAVDLGEGSAAQDVELPLQPQVHEGRVVQVQVVAQVHIDVQPDVRAPFPEFRNGGDPQIPLVQLQIPGQERFPPLCVPGRNSR